MLGPTLEQVFEAFDLVRMIPKIRPVNQPEFKIAALRNDLLQEAFLIWAHWEYGGIVWC